MKSLIEERYYNGWMDNTNGFENPQTAYYKVDHYSRILIPIEIDRLEYLISYCLKNYYIKHANFVADGEYVPKWRYDNLADAARLDYERNDGALQNLSVTVNGERYNII